MKKYKDFTEMKERFITNLLDDELAGGYMVKDFTVGKYFITDGSGKMRESLVMNNQEGMRLLAIAEGGEIVRVAIGSPLKERGFIRGQSMPFDCDVNYYDNRIVVSYPSENIEFRFGDVPPRGRSTYIIAAQGISSDSVSFLIRTDVGKNILCYAREGYHCHKEISGSLTTKIFDYLASKSLLIYNAYDGRVLIGNCVERMFLYDIEDSVMEKEFVIDNMSKNVTVLTSRDNICVSKVKTVQFGGDGYWQTIEDLFLYDSDRDTFIDVDGRMIGFGTYRRMSQGNMSRHAFTIK